MNFQGLQLNKSLENSLNALDRENRMPHAFIISGGSQKSRGELCDCLSAWAVCSSEGEKPCGECKNCKNAFERVHSDIYYAKGSGKTQIYKAEELKEIVRDASIKPNQADRKVYVFEECDKRLPQIPNQGILLKTIEEPPQDILFILTCENSKTLLETIRSRAVTLNLGDGKKTSEQASELSEEILASMLKSSEFELLKATYKLSDRFASLETLECVESILADALCMQTGYEPKGAADIAEQLCGTLTKTQFLELIEITRSAQLKVNQNVSLELISTWLCSQYRKTVR
ncbi:MAG: hypothetical protein K6F88_00050 [Ruminococcus sp.]|nr:hypothetical protein [Ruminococcus sp.]